MGIKSRIKYRISRFIKNIKTKETKEDKKLQNNQEENREVIVTRETGSYYDYNAFLVYVNSYEKIVNLYGDNYMREIIERDISEIKILIESTIDKHFLDSLNFFHKINNQNIDPKSFIQTSFVKTSFLFSPSGNEEKAYILISGSIGNYIDLFDRYYFRYANERNKIIKSILDIFDSQIPVVRDRYTELNEKYNLNMRGLRYGDTVVSNMELLDNRSLRNINGCVLLDIDIYNKSILVENMDNSIKKILNIFFEDEISKNEFNMVCFFRETENKEKEIPKPIKINMFKLSYLIDNFDEKFDNLDHFYTYNKYALVNIKKQASSLIGSNYQSITYHNDIDSGEMSEQLSMYDLIDEIIK